MKANKTTQREVKRLINSGAAIELTSKSGIRPSELTCVAMSFGIYGMNAGLFKDETTGQLYGIQARTPELFYYC